MRVGILGGAFNPPHIGHLVCGQEALLEYELDAVTFVPVGQPPHREIEQDPGAEARLEMCEQAVADDPRFRTSRVELDREGPSYTVDTLRALREGDPDDELFLILGGDQAGMLATWREPEEVLSQACVVIVPRTGWSREAITVKISAVRGSHRVRYFDMPRIDVSSTLVRRRAAQGRPIRYLVPDRVAEYIAANGLYGATAPITAE